MLLSPKQQTVWSQARARWNVLVGAASSGKTYLSYYLKAKRMRTQPPGNVLLVGRTERTYERNVLDPMRELFGEELVGQVKGKGTVELFGRRCYLVGANDERSVTKIQGLSLVYADGDEFTTWPESFFQMLKSRLRQPGAICDLTANPEGPYHWGKTFIDGTKNLKYWHFVLEDNPFLDPAYVEAIKAEYTGIWYKRYILGLWCAASGAIYDMLDESAHVVPDSQIPGITNYFVGCDYGTSSVTTFWLLGIGSDNLYLLDFWTWDAKEQQKQKTDLELTVALENWLNDKAIVPTWIFIPGDAASFIAQLWQTKKERQRAGQPTPLLHLDVADRSPGSVLNGIRDVSTLLGAGKLLFAKSIADRKGLVEMIGYTWDEKAQARGEDAPLKENDHSCDAIRYVVVGAKRWWQKLLH
mgnify:CR=1 FL=1